eukprot:CAMPEP_0197493042 /NCGR_PEP_ID=MMETSP1311-20131121/18347_1 /TAXON_ID=464262 /ORGANISM="Genus nov. species nov., Strain RCC856" /LENGTH=147 /DNA_ID=CAMNT_0043038211 /DNA_START=89 /DNA_END=529 /DNA_ORIENTATION=-
MRQLGEEFEGDLLERGALLLRVDGLAHHLVVPVSPVDLPLARVPPVQRPRPPALEIVDVKHGLEVRNEITAHLRDLGVEEGGVVSRRPESVELPIDDDNRLAVAQAEEFLHREHLVDVVGGVPDEVEGVLARGDAVGDGPLEGVEAN